MNADAIAELFAGRCIAHNCECWLTAKQSSWLSSQWHHENLGHANADPRGLLKDGSVWRLHVTPNGSGYFRVTTSVAMTERAQGEETHRQEMVAQYEQILAELEHQGCQGSLIYNIASDALTRLKLA